MTSAASPRHHRRVDPAAARSVAAAYAASPSSPRDPVVVHAYRELAAQVDRRFRYLTEKAPAPIRVVFTASSEPYDDAAELSTSIRRDRLLEIRSAVRDRERRHPLLDPSCGQTFDRLRAVHDIVSHGLLRLDFDRDGEYSAWRAEHQLYAGIARWALATELHAHHSVRWTSGEVAECKALLLAPSLLARSMRSGRPAGATIAASWGPTATSLEGTRASRSRGVSNMSFYLSNSQSGPTGFEPLEFIDDPIPLTGDVRLEPSSEPQVPVRATALDEHSRWWRLGRSARRLRRRGRTRRAG